MRDKLYILEHKETKKKIGYAFINDSPIVIDFRKKNMPTCVVKKDTEAEKAIYEKESKYNVLFKSDFNEPIAESAHTYLKYILKLNILFNYLNVSNSSQLGGSIENLFEGLNDIVDTVNIFKKNNLEDTLNNN